MVSKKTATRVLVVVMIGIVLLLPKIGVLYRYPSAKLGADPWSHLKDIIDLSGENKTTSVSYYSVFPIVYAHSLFLLETTGINAFYIPTIYYLVINLLTALTLYKTFQILAKLERERKNTKRIPLPIIAVLVYSILQYPNTAILRELPQATGFLSICLAFYVLLKMHYTRDHRFVTLGILVALLSLSHPFAPIFLTSLYLSYKILNRLGKGTMNLPTISFVLLPLLMEILYFMTLPFFEGSVGSFVANLGRGVQIAFGLRAPPLQRFGEVSMDLKYPMAFERLLYGLNWALPVAAVLSSILVFGVRALKNRKLKLSNPPDIFIHACAFLSAVLSGFAFVFSPVEYAFARYFGAYAVLIAIPVLTYLLSKALEKPNAIKGLVVLIIMLTALAMLTDHDYYPNLRVDGFCYRERKATSEIATTHELYAAKFLTETFASDPYVLVERTYSSTIAFYAYFSQSSSKQMILEAVSYPMTIQEIEQFVRPRAHQYIILREAKVLENLSSIPVKITYSNGEVWGLLR
jgi:hypothetical protein